MGTPVLSLQRQHRFGTPLCHQVHYLQLIFLDLDGWCPLENKKLVHAVWECSQAPWEPKITLRACQLSFGRYVNRITNSFKKCPVSWCGKLGLQGQVW